ncbi:hypothetical protein DFH11DRAFT_910893 [Phellopilus nigrolimitatus]|nr:hypothetical protein DFH11DRAFT_910893 [Phellopilus nigrolimitatus]
MVHFSSLLAFAITVTVVSAIPLQKRIAQTISDSTQAWQQACTTAGGASQCNTISQTAFTTLLAAGGNCDQQNAADSMIDLAKQLKNDPEMIRLAQLFVQQPRNAPDSLQVPYCQTAPDNTELSGLFHCQFASSDFTKFSGDQTGNVPLGLSAVSPAGSCPAKTDGPVPDGVQLNSLVQSPGTPEGGNATGGASASSAPAGASPSSSTITGATASAASSTPVASSPLTAVSSSSAAAPSIAAAATSSAPGAQPFTLQNGLDAQKANAAAATLASGSACTAGSAPVCAGMQLGQCVGTALVTTACSSGTQCFVLPLVNKAGTSAACTTQNDAATRIAATGATGGVTGA